MGVVDANDYTEGLFSKFFVWWMQRSGMNPLQICASLGLHPDTVFAIASGEVQPDPRHGDNIHRFARLFQLSPDAIELLIAGREKLFAEQAAAEVMQKFVEFLGRQSREAG